MINFYSEHELTLPFPVRVRNKWTMRGKESQINRKLHETRVL